MGWFGLSSATSGPGFYWYGAACGYSAGFLLDAPGPRRGSTRGLNELRSSVRHSLALMKPCESG